jgi:hypothetical protein
MGHLEAKEKDQVPNCSQQLETAPWSTSCLVLQRMWSGNFSRYFSNSMRADDSLCMIVFGCNWSRDRNEAYICNVLLWTYERGSSYSRRCCSEVCRGALVPRSPCTTLMNFLHEFISSRWIGSPCAISGSLIVVFNHSWTSFFRIRTSSYVRADFFPRITLFRRCWTHYINKVYVFIWSVFLWWHWDRGGSNNMCFCGR